jgi:glucose/arabinose dehydrogenase
MKPLLAVCLVANLLLASTGAVAAPKTTVLNDTLSSPWSLAFLPDGRMLVTQKGGTMLLLGADGRTASKPLAGVPAVVDSGQGGLLDVVLDPDFSTPGSNWVYFSYAEAGPGGSGTAVSRARLDIAGNRLTDVTRIFQQQPKVRGSGHFGSRLVFRPDKTLFITLGDRQKGSPAQDLGSHIGKVLRINRDGSVPAGNPALGADARPEIWSYGHRNSQGAALHPTTGELWELEHGPQGGDELNIARAGANYGWPQVSYGCPYGARESGCEIGGGVHAPGYTEPVSRWPAPGTPTPHPSIAPSGLIFYTGRGFPEWQGNVFVGALLGTALWRVVLDGNTEVSRERLFASLGERIRSVRQGPDGWIYLLTDSGKLIRVER